MVRIAADLYAFSERELWRPAGYESFNAFLADPDVELPPSTGHHLVAAYRQLVVERGLSAQRLEGVELSKVKEILPALRRGHVDADQALADVEALSWRDLRQHYRHLTARSPGEPDPPLEATDEPVWSTCPACGQRFPVRSS